jgi:hypothetical protein
MRHIHTPDLIEVLRRTIRDLEHSARPNDPAIQRLKGSILRTIADLELREEHKESDERKRCA